MRLGSLLFTFLFRPLLHPSLPVLHPVLLHLSRFLCFACPPGPPALVSLVLACPLFLLCLPGFVFRILLPGQDLSPAILSPSLRARQLPITPCALTLPRALPSPSVVPALHGNLPSGILSLRRTQLRLLPLPCSPLIEMLMRLLLLPSPAGRRAPWPASAPVR